MDSVVLPCSVIFLARTLHMTLSPFFTLSSDSEDAIIRPLPRAKRLLSEPNTLPHIVQLLLTFDPRLVEKVVTLLNIIMEVCVCMCKYRITSPLHRSYFMSPGQPCHSSGILHWCVLLHNDVHWLQYSAHCPLPQVFAYQAGIQARWG